MDDIIRAMLIEENGVLKLSKSEVDYVETLSKAAEMMQRIHNRDFDGFSSEMKNFLFDDAVAHNVMIDDNLALEIEVARARIAKAALTIAFDEVKRFRQKYNGAV
jgi:hypothetical protein